MAQEYPRNGHEMVYRSLGWLSLIGGSTKTSTFRLLRTEPGCQIIRAIEWGITNHPPTSGGDGIRVYCIPQLFHMAAPVQRQVLEDMIQVAADKGAVVCVPLGNEPPLMVPATAPSAITVGAFDKNGEGKLDDSVHRFDPPRGEQPEQRCKPEALAQWQAYPFWPHGGSGAGTSLAVAHAAGTIARWLIEHPTWKTGDVREHMKTSLRRLADASGKMPSCDPEGYPVIDWGCPDLPWAPR